tara:strand:+ start:808 stop:1023 length:216 start_codon:yes stop_codon:yes gene_type:complete
MLTVAYSFPDQKMQQQIANGALLLNNAQLTALPLLGVPGWYSANIRASFYLNTVISDQLQQKYQATIRKLI